MGKEIIKQTAIVILACIAILLALALILYRYIPSNKVVPSKVQAYAMPENIKAEIDEKTEEELREQSQIYEVTDSDLDMYKRAKSYNPGKSDPFADAEPEGENSTTGASPTNASGGGSTSSGQNQNTNTTVDRNTTDNYYTAANISRGGK